MPICPDVITGPVTPDRLLGRVVASYRMVGLAGIPIGAVVGGVVATVAGIRSVFAVVTGFGAVAVVLLARAVLHVPENGQADAPE